MASNARDAELLDDGPVISIDRLRNELEADGSLDDQRSAQVLHSVLESLFPGEAFRFDEEMVKGSLDELLLLLVGLREDGTHGKGLMDDLSTLFDAQLSPGTVYPRLHELEEEDLLEMHELVRTKEYHVDDREAAREEIAAAMRQHLAIGLFLQTALDEF
ncbi:MAG: helix-turn-helix transcriptional regulator [Haloarculaceae archaeon]